MSNLQKWRGTDSFSPAILLQAKLTAGSFEGGCRVDSLCRSNYSNHMITNLREAKSNLSQLVQLAADGEEIVITVRGRPTARLTSVVPRETQCHERKAWADELLGAAEVARVGPRKATSQKFWDELREERL
jgi:prevent-host-death family protein